MNGKSDEHERRKERRCNLETSYAEYTELWENSSFSLAGQGAYPWMAGSLDGLTRVLEIGTGTGRSTLELLSQGHAVTSIDENPTCLERTHKSLAASGFMSVLLLRGTRNFSSVYYQIQYSPLDPCIAEPGPGTALLIEADVGNDARLLRWLGMRPKFDAVACWLVGTHPQRKYNEVYQRRRKRGQPGIESDADYRLWTQNTVYELADVVLRPGGKLSVVDRGRSLEREAYRLEVYESHLEQASVTSLRVQGPGAIAEFIYSETPTGVPLVGSGTRPIDKISLHCVVSVK